MVDDLLSTSWRASHDSSHHLPPSGFLFSFPTRKDLGQRPPGGPSLGSAVDEQQGVTEGETKQEEVISSPPAS